jgi:alkylation response protein AidB-like acyl-CoA dehydrogenase
VDLSFSSDQRAVLDAVEAIFAKQAGSERAREVGASGHDDALVQVLDENGFLDLWAEPELGPLGAALVVEAASRRNVRANLGVSMLVAPALLGPDRPRRVAVTHRANRGPVRFGQHADVLLTLDGTEAFVATVTGAEPVASPYGFPYAHVATSDERPLGAGTGSILSAWWRVALAVEIGGALDGAVTHTVDYLSQRVQFRKPLGSLQALQHRLAEAYVWAEGAKWLARRAAWSGAAIVDATAAAAHATHAAQIIGADMHQLSGAIGFTTEFDLQLWTTRLHGLRVELGGTTAHQLATAAAHWG